LRLSRAAAARPPFAFERVDAANQQDSDTAKLAYVIQHAAIFANCDGKITSFMGEARYEIPWHLYGGTLVNKGLIGVAAIAATIATPALAADLALKAPPQAVVGPSWTGFYLGAGFGEGFYDAAGTVTTFPTGGSPLTQATDAGGKGWVARLTVGYDRQFNSSLVGGIFANYDPEHIKGTIANQGANNFFNPLAGTMTETRDWAIGARLGYLFTPSTLGYVNGGYTQAHFGTVNVFDIGAGRFVGQMPAHTYSGWFMGGGIETPLTLLPIPGLFVNTEYRYASYNAATLLNPSFGTGQTIRPTVQTITSGLVYKFNPDPTATPAASAPLPPPPVTWSGLYVGAGGGYGFWDADTTPVTSGVPLTSTINNAGQGWLARFTAGVDYQFKGVFDGRVVGGVFANFDADSLKGTFNTAASKAQFDPLGGQTRERSDWAVGARLGYLLTPATLSYVDGGYTEARFGAINVADLQLPPFSPATGQIAAHTYNGWFLGGGLETQVTLLPVRGLFFNTEYRYASYQSATSPIIAPGGGVAVIGGLPTSVTIRPTVQTITSGLTYKFNWVQ
jgi:outer membrane immunogenic protein